MTNVNAPFGFKAKYTPGFVSPPINVFAPRGYSIATGYNTAIFMGSMVKLTGTADSDGRPGIALAAAGDTANAGVLHSVEYVDTDGITHRGRWPASQSATLIRAYVYDHPLTVFEVQNDSDSATPAVGDISNKADYTAETGSTTTGLSTIQLDTSNIGTGDALEILGLEPRGDNDFGAYAKYDVVIREHARGGVTSGLMLAV